MGNTVNPYLSADSRSIDDARLARDIAAVIGGTVAETGTQHGGDIFADMPEIGKVRITVYGGRGGFADREKATLAIYPADIPFDFACRPIYGDQFSLPSIKVSTSRPLVHIIADMKRRLFAPAADPLALRRQRAREANDYQNATETTANAIRVSCPLVKVEKRPHSDSTTVYANSGGGYLSGSVSGEKINIDRIGALTLKQFQAVCKAIFDNPEG